MKTFWFGPILKKSLDSCIIFSHIFLTRTTYYVAGKSMDWHLSVLHQGIVNPTVPDFALQSLLHPSGGSSFLLSRAKIDTILQ